MVFICNKLILDCLCVYIYLYIYCILGPNMVRQEQAEYIYERLNASLSLKKICPLLYHTHHPLEPSVVMVTMAKLHT